MSHIDDTAEIITDPTAIDCGCSGGCGRMPDEMVITGTAGCAPLCIHCYTRAVREDERRQSAATPPPGTVAALLAVVDAAAKKAEAVAEAREYEAQEPHSIGVAAGLREAARLITAALGIPTPLERAMAEVCALLPREYPDGATEATRTASSKAALAALDVEEGDIIGARAQMVDAMADLLGALLACDAPATKEPG